MSEEDIIKEFICSDNFIIINDYITKPYEETIKEQDKEIERLYKIINEISEILKFHLSNPSQTINGWHIDIWNSKDIEKLNKMLEIIEVKEENNG